MTAEEATPRNGERRIDWEYLARHLLAAELDRHVGEIRMAFSQLARLMERGEPIPEEMIYELEFVHRQAGYVVEHVSVALHGESSKEVSEESERSR